MTRFVPLDDDDDEPRQRGRQILDGEERLLQRVRDVTRSQPVGVQIELVEIAQQLGLGPQRARQIARTWKNEGRYVAGSRIGRGRLTQKGREDALP
jgi:hypothetical protein